MNRNAGNDFAVMAVEVVRCAISHEELKAAGAVLEQMVQNGPFMSVMLSTHVEPPEPVSLSAIIDQCRNTLVGATDEWTGILDTLRVIVKQLVGYEPVPFQDVFLCKPPNSQILPWHQDLPFWPVDRDDGCVAWLALDSCDESNGAVEFGIDDPFGSVGPSIDFRTGLAQPGTSGTAIVPQKVVQPRLNPGDVVVFDARTWHRSGRNTTSAPRRGLAVSFVHPDTRWCSFRAPRHPLCRQVKSGEKVIVWSQQTYRRALV